MKIEKITEKREVVTTIDEDVYVLKLSKEELKYIWHWAVDTAPGYLDLLAAAARLDRLIPQEVKYSPYLPEKCFLPNINIEPQS